MSVEAMTWAFQVPLKPCPKAVLVALANRADKDGYCWPGLDDLELRTGWNRRSIQRALKSLEADGLLTVSPRFSSTGVQTSNLYQLALAPISCMEGDRVSPQRVTGCRGEGDRVSPQRVTGCRGEGDRVSPKSSSEQSVEQSSEQSPHSPPTRGALVVVGGYSSAFDQFWEAYPNKVGKKVAWRAWEKAKDRPPIEALVQAIGRAQRSSQWQRGYIPNPATWLNQGRWLDDHAADGLPRRATSVVDWLMLQGGHG